MLEAGIGLLATSGEEPAMVAKNADLGFSTAALLLWRFSERAEFGEREIGLSQEWAGGSSRTVLSAFVLVYIYPSGTFAKPSGKVAGTRFTST